MDENGNIRTFSGGYRVAAKVRTQVGTYYATSPPTVSDSGYIGFEGVKSDNIHDGYYPSPSLVQYHGAYAIEYL
jgi:hypothetical protein